MPMVEVKTGSTEMGRELHLPYYHVSQALSLERTDLHLNPLMVNTIQDSYSRDLFGSFVSTKD